MSAARDTKAIQSLAWAHGARALLEEAMAGDREARVRFIRDALDAGWSWSRIGTALEQSASAARSYWAAHRFEATRLGESDAQVVESVA